MEFMCVNKTTKRTECWKGKIVTFKNYGTHYELFIESRSSIQVIFGKTTRGWFACMPDFGVGCHLVSSKDRFWNSEKLSKVLGKVDGITVEAAFFEMFEQSIYGVSSPIEENIAL